MERSRGSSKDFHIMCLVLEHLCKAAEKSWRKYKYASGDDIDKETIRNHEKLEIIIPPLSAKRFEDLVKAATEKGDFELKFKGMYLPPLEDNREFVSVLSLKCHLKPPSRLISILVEMYRYGPQRTSNLQAIGYRFEIGQPGSEHDYHHVQLTNPRDRREKGDPEPQCPEWLPTSIPRILTPAQCPVSLVLCVLVSFYGVSVELNRMVATLNLDKRYTEILKFSV